MSAAQSKPGPRLSSVQRFVLKQFLLTWNGVFEPRYNATRAALFHKGLLTSPAGGTLTDAGRALARLELQAEIARRAERCQSCGGTGFYAAGPLGRDACTDCDGTGNAKHSTPTAIGAALAKAQEAAS